MPRRRSSCPAAFAGVAILVATLATADAWAQAPVVGGLRTAIDDNAPDQLNPSRVPNAPPRPRQAPSREPSRIGQEQIYGTPPASGAGTSGFDSSNTRRRRTAPGTNAGAPQNILGPAAIPVPPGSSWTSRPGMPRLPSRAGSRPASAEPGGAPAPSGSTTSGESPSSAPPPLSAPPPPRNQRPPRGPAGRVPPADATQTTAAPSLAAPVPAAAAPAGTPAPAPALPPGSVPPVGVPAPPTSAAAPGTPIAAVPYPGVAAPLVPVRPRPAAEADPYEQLGIRVGSFIVRSALEITGGYDTNPARLPDGKPSVFYQIAPELLARSDWERHQLSVELRSSLSEYPDVRLANRPYVDARTDGRIDVTRQSHIDLEARYLLSTDYPGSPNLPAGIAKLPIFQTLGGTAGFTQDFNRLEIAVKGTVDHTAYQDSQLVDGTTSSNRDRDYTKYSGALRGSYEVLPGVRPFAELYADTRIHDLEVDRFGNMRDSEALIPRIGSTVDITRTLTGEISVGYVERTYKDPRLPDLRGLLVDGSLVWTATALTSVKLTAKSVDDESVLANVSGVLRRDAGVEVDHAFRTWLIGTAKLGFGLDEYVGSTRIDHRYSASVGLAYKLTRTVQVRGELRQEWLRSNLPGNDYTATIALIGLRLQR